MATQKDDGAGGRRWWWRWPSFRVAADATDLAPLLSAIFDGAPCGVCVQPVPVDWERWAGAWYEVARLPVPYEALCAGLPRATYTPRPGSAAIDVVNECDDARDGGRPPQRTRGVARPVGAGRLWVDFGRGPEPTPDERAMGNYWVLYVDPTYSEAIVATPDLQSAWALSRYPCPEPDAVAALVERMRALGVDTRRLIVNRP